VVSRARLRVNRVRAGHWLLVKVLRPIHHKIGHFGDVPQANLFAWYVVVCSVEN